MCDGQGMGWGRVTRCYKPVIVLSHTHTHSLSRLLLSPFKLDIWHSQLPLPFQHGTVHGHQHDSSVTIQQQANEETNHCVLARHSSDLWQLVSKKLLTQYYSMVMMYINQASFNIQQIWSSLHDTSCQPIHEGMRMVGYHNLGNLLTRLWCRAISRVVDLQFGCCSV